MKINKTQPYLVLKTQGTHKGRVRDAHYGFVAVKYDVRHQHVTNIGERVLFIG